VTPLLAFDPCLYQDPVITSLSSFSTDKLHTLAEDMYGDTGYPLLSSLIQQITPKVDDPYCMDFESLYNVLYQEAQRTKTLLFLEDFPSFKSFSRIFKFFRVIFEGEHLASVLVNRHGREIPFLNLHASGIRSSFFFLVRESLWGARVTPNYAMCVGKRIVPWQFTDAVGVVPQSRYCGLYYDIEHGKLIGDHQDAHIHSGNHVLVCKDDRFRVTCKTCNVQYVDFTLSGAMQCSLDCCLKPACAFCLSTDYESGAFGCGNTGPYNVFGKTFAEYAEQIGYTAPNFLFLYRFMSSGMRGDIRRAVLMMMEIYASHPHAPTHIAPLTFDKVSFEESLIHFFLMCSATDISVDEKVEMIDFFRKHEVSSCSVHGSVAYRVSMFAKRINASLNQVVIDERIVSYPTLQVSSSSVPILRNCMSVKDEIAWSADRKTLPHAEVCAKITKKAYSTSVAPLYPVSATSKIQTWDDLHAALSHPAYSGSSFIQTEKGMAVKIPASQ